MKKVILLCLAIIISISTCPAQDWFTSLDVAKKLALTQNKFLFVLWEDAINEPYFILVNDKAGNVLLADLTESETINETIWEYFIPVLLPEALYGELLDNSQNRGEAYLNKLEDDSIKIMDVNGNILNTFNNIEREQNLSTIIDMYALNTSYLNASYRNYIKEKNFTTSFLLASKHLDFAIFAKNTTTRTKLVKLANLYFGEARTFLSTNEFQNKKAFDQKLNLQEIKSALLLNKSRKARRLLKRYEESDIDNINRRLYVFLNYTTFMMLQERDTGAIWKGQMSSLEIQKADLIIKNTNPNWKPF